jgi:hypothetical protein
MNSIRAVRNQRRRRHSGLRDASSLQESETLGPESLDNLKERRRLETAERQRRSRQLRRAEGMEAPPKWSVVGF